jgi:geranylgeranyl reductase family protein
VPRFDVIVVGAGPGGAVTALCLARAGARVALVDKRSFPRDKACGDVIGPRGVRVLTDLGIVLSGARRVGDMIVVGPNGRRARLPALPGIDYPDHALAITRHRLDAALVDAAIRAGAVQIHDRVSGLDGDGSSPGGVCLAGGARLSADVIVGADGAISNIADAAGLVNGRRVLWGFALRSYVDTSVDLPHILLWEPQPWQLFPGYGWIFPTSDGGANVGLGLAVGAHRAGATRATAQFGDFLRHLTQHGLIPHGSAGERMGGWLKMGAVGTYPARGNVLLVGDAAGLINPLQGEGITQAMASGRAAAEAIVAAGPVTAARLYHSALYDMTRHHRLNAPVQAGMIEHPKAVSITARALTAPLVRTAVAGAWSLYWNDLVQGARPSHHRRLAVSVTRLVSAMHRSVILRHLQQAEIAPRQRG